MTRPAPCATLQGRLTLALLAHLEQGISDRWVEGLANEACLHLVAELVAHEQAAGRALSLQDACSFLSREIQL